MLSLEGRVALVTGASRGIGRSAALLLAAHGARVAVNYSQSEEEARRVAEEIDTAGGQAMAVAADVSSRTDVMRMIGEIEGRWGTVDILMNNAGVAADVPVLQMTDEQWSRVLDVSLRGTFICSQLVAPAMLAKKKGIIVNVSAATALRGRKNGANYCAAKAGVIALTKCFALEWAPYIRVNTLLPGFTWTQEVVDRFGLNDPAVLEQVMQTIPMGRFATTDEMAKAVLYLVSDLSIHMTGQMLCINGGSFMG